MQLVPLVFRETEIAERSLLAVVSRFGEHARQDRDALAVPVRVGRLGVDRAGQDLNEGLQQVPLRFEQSPVVQRHRGVGGKRLHVGHRLLGEDRAARAPSRLDQLQDTDHLALLGA